MVQAHGWAELILGLNHYVSETSYFWLIRGGVLFYTFDQKLTKSNHSDRINDPYIGNSQFSCQVEILAQILRTNLVLDYF
jgi:hypothetical protein